MREKLEFLFLCTIAAVTTAALTVVLVILSAPEIPSAPRSEPISTTLPTPLPLEPLPEPKPAHASLQDCVDTYSPNVVNLWQACVSIKETHSEKSFDRMFNN